MLFRHLQYQVISYAIQQIQSHVKQVIKVIKIGDNELLFPYTKSFQTIIGLFCIYHLKIFIKNNHAIKLKYIE